MNRPVTKAEVLHIYTPITVEVNDCTSSASDASLADKVPGLFYG